MLPFLDTSDDFYVNVNLNTETDTASARDSVMHFFEQMQKKYPDLTNFYSRERGEFVLEAEKDQGFYRWTSVDPRRICSGFVNPPDYQDAINQHVQVMESLPYTLSISPLDCESLNFMYGFDFTYRGNHNELLAETLGVVPAFDKMSEIPGARLVGHDPSIQIALDEDCRTQARISIESRTNAYHLRTGEFPEEQISVYLTVRRYGSLAAGQSFAGAITKLQDHAERIAEQFLLENVLRPLQQAIALQ